jgi:UDP-N-acetylmuramoylalanine--D-glutamate ligase
VALITNLSPNHLDRHGTMDAYGAAKQVLFKYQQPGDVLILNAECDATRSWADIAAGRVDWFSTQEEAFALRVPGKHNQANAQAAWVTGRAMGVGRSEAAMALAGFTGLPDRLEYIGQRGGVRYYNDSKCTTPAGAVVALEAFEPRRSVLIAGGYDKHVSFDELGAVIVRQAKAVVLIGATADRLADVVAAAKAAAGSAPESPPVVRRAETLAKAVDLAARTASEGDAVLLSPACASYDMFTNYEQRGRQFRELVEQL